MELAPETPIIDRSISSSVGFFFEPRAAMGRLAAGPVCLFLAFRSLTNSRSMYIAQNTSDFLEDVDVDSPALVTSGQILGSDNLNRL